MNEEKVQENVEAALDVETFDVLSYLEDQPVAEDEVTIYTHVGKSRKLSGLLAQRRELIAERKDLEKKMDISSLSIADEEYDTEMDDEINELIAELEKSGLTFSIQTVPPALIRAVEAEGVAKAQKTWTEEQKASHQEKTTASILARAIVKVTRGDGAVDNNPWDGERLLEAEKTLYVEQGQRLVGALYDMVYTGRVFEEALSVDF